MNDVDADGLADTLDVDDNSVIGFFDGGVALSYLDSDNDGIVNVLDLDVIMMVLPILLRQEVSIRMNAKVPVLADGSHTSDLDGDGLSDDPVIDSDLDGAADLLWTLML